MSVTARVIINFSSHRFSNRSIILCRLHCGNTTNCFQSTVITSYFDFYLHTQSTVCNASERPPNFDLFGGVVCAMAARHVRARSSARERSLATAGPVQDSAPPGNSHGCRLACRDAPTRTPTHREDTLCVCVYSIHNTTRLFLEFHGVRVLYASAIAVKNNVSKLSNEARGWKVFVMSSSFNELMS